MRTSPLPSVHALSNDEFILQLGTAAKRDATTDATNEDIDIADAAFDPTMELRPEDLNNDDFDELDVDENDSTCNPTMKLRPDDSQNDRADDSDATKASSVNTEALPVSEASTA